LQLWIDDDDDVDINSIWESIRENIKALATESLGCYELKEHKLWFEEKYSKEAGKIAVKSKQCKT